MNIKEFAFKLREDLLTNKDAKEITKIICSCIKVLNLQDSIKLTPDEVSMDIDYFIKKII